MPNKDTPVIDPMIMQLLKDAARNDTDGSSPGVYELGPVSVNYFPLRGRYAFWLNNKLVKKSVMAEWLIADRSKQNG